LVTVAQQKEYVCILSPMDTCRVTKEYITTRHGYTSLVTIAHVIALV